MRDFPVCTIYISKEAPKRRCIDKKPSFAGRVCAWWFAGAQLSGDSDPRFDLLTHIISAPFCLVERWALKSKCPTVRFPGHGVILNPAALSCIAGHACLWNLFWCGDRARLQFACWVVQPHLVLGGVRFDSKQNVSGYVGTQILGARRGLAELYSWMRRTTTAKRLTQAVHGRYVARQFFGYTPERSDKGIGLRNTNSNPETLAFPGWLVFSSDGDAIQC